MLAAPHRFCIIRLLRHAAVFISVLSASSSSQAAGTFQGRDGANLLPNDIGSSSDGEWRELMPLPRREHSITYDPIRERLILFGGYLSNGAQQPRNDIWVLDTGMPDAGWTKVEPLGTPPQPRSGHTAIYDPNGERIIVFGGYGGPSEGATFGYFSDVWALSLDGQLTWSQLNPSGSPPSARAYHSAVFDSFRNRMVIFGGFSDFGCGPSKNDTWILDLDSTPEWHRLPEQRFEPPERRDHSAVYDRFEDRMLVFGGNIAGCIPTDDLDDLWQLSFADPPTWQEIPKSAPWPPGLTRHTAIVDSSRAEMVVFGGLTDGIVQNDTWILELTQVPTWRTKTIPGLRPQGLIGHAASYDGAHDQMFVMGRTETWRLSLAEPAVWHPFHRQSPPPSGRLGCTFVWDAEGERAILFGGNDGTVRNDVWELTPDSLPRWTQLSTTGSPPSGRYNHSAVYDPLRQRMLVFGGQSENDVWALALGTTPQWTLLTPTGTRPEGRDYHSAIYDPVRDRMIVFGGSGFDGWLFGDVWALKLSPQLEWTELHPSGTAPARRRTHTAIYDTTGHRMIVFGGATSEGVKNDVWSLNLGGTPEWVELSPTGTPPRARFQQSAIYDGSRSRMVIFGGSFGSTGELGDAWALSLTGTPRWTELQPAGSAPIPRGRHATIHDESQGQMVLFGGSRSVDGGHSLGDTWALGWPDSVVSGDERLPPIALQLSQSFPNPGHHEVTIQFTLPQADDVRLDVFDVAGRSIANLLDEHLPAGRHVSRWNRMTNDGRMAPPGVYVYRLVVGSVQLSRLLVIVN